MIGTVRMHRCYSKKYSYVLTTGNAEDILSISPQTQLLVMKALASLSKFMGCYDTWESIKKRYQLKWTYGDGYSFFNSINNGNTFNSML